jgi:hypothetical protein
MKYTVESGAKSVDRVLYLMSYDMNKTATENVLYEQTQNNKNSFFLQNQPSGKKPTNTKGMIPGFEKVKSSITQEDFEKFVYENRHGLLDIAAIGAAFIPLVGPFISLGLELGNAALYASEGDKYSAGLALAFSLIPGGKIPAVRKLGRNGLEALLKKAKNPKLVKTLSNAEKEALEQINKNSKWVRLTAAQQLSKKMVYSIVSKIKLPQLVKLVYSLSKKYPKTYNITSIGLEIGGIWYSYDKLAEIYGIKPISPEVNKQNKSQINPKELELKYNENKDKIEEQVSESLTGGLTDEEKNLKFQKAFLEESRKLNITDK